MRILKSTILTIILTATLGVVGTLGQGEVIYDATTSPLPPNLVSLGYQATQTAEFGDYITFGGTRRRLGTATVTMSNWALRSSYPTMSAVGFTHPITVNVYAVDFSGPNPAPGALLATKTQSFLIPWRPAEDPVNCPTKTDPGYAYKWQAVPGAPDTNCYNGFAVNITFDLKSLNVILPDDVIVGIAYNTNTWGYTPINASGPYESLNVGLATTAPSVGVNADLDEAFWAGGNTPVFLRETGWAPYTPAVKFTSAVPGNAEDCKKGGWQFLTRANGTTFRNQGDCIQYVNTGR